MIKLHIFIAQQIIFIEFFENSEVTIQIIFIGLRLHSIPWPYTTQRAPRTPHFNHELQIFSSTDIIPITFSSHIQEISPWLSKDALLT